MHLISNNIVWTHFLLFFFILTPFISNYLNLKVIFLKTSARGYKTFFTLISAEHEIFTAHKYENIKNFSIFQAQISRFPAHKCLNANNCWHFKIYEQEKFHAQLSMKLFYNLTSRPEISLTYQKFGINSALEISIADCIHEYLWNHYCV